MSGFNSVNMILCILECEITKSLHLDPSTDISGDLLSSLNNSSTLPCDCQFLHYFGNMLHSLVVLDVFIEVMKIANHDDKFAWYSPSATC